MSPNADSGRAIEHAFRDPIRDMTCVLVIPADGRIFPLRGEPKIGIAHPGCESLADLSVELDAFYCQACRWNGRVSGAWCVDMIDATLPPNDSSETS
jgi:hypothetical protein